MGKNNNTQFANSHKVCVCLDTNIVISLASLHFNKEYEIGQMQKFGQLEDMCEFKKLIDKKEVVAIVTPYVLEELLQGSEKYGEDTIKYLQKSNIKVLDIPDDKLDEYFEKVEKIATTYSGKLNRSTIDKICAVNNMEYCPFPKRVFKMEKNRYGELCVQNDARIMAEASSLGVALITNNTLDFINSHRQEILRYINQKLHLPSKAIPFTPKDFVRRYGYNQVFSSPKSENAKYITSAKEAEMVQV